MTGRKAFYQVSGSFYPTLKILQCFQMHLEGNPHSLQDPGWSSPIFATILYYFWTIVNVFYTINISSSWRVIGINVFEVFFSLDLPIAVFLFTSFICASQVKDLFHVHFLSMSSFSISYKYLSKQTICLFT